MHNRFYQIPLPKATNLNKMVHYSSCPICGSKDVEDFLKAKDYTVTGEIFPIQKCKNCTGAFTNDVPASPEIGAYYQSENYISHSDTSKGLVNSLYHKVRNHTLHSKKRLVLNSTQKQSGHVLDIGCGTAAFLNTMKNAGWQITGVEPDATAREKAHALYNISPLPSEDLKTLPGQSFDAITLWHVLEHVHDLHGYLHQIKTLLKPNGKIFIAVPNYTAFDARHYHEYWAAYDVPRHLYHFSPKSIAVLMNMHQLNVVALKPMWFDSFYVSLLSEKYKTGRTNLLSACITGFFSNLKAGFNTQKCSSVIYIAGQEKSSA